MVATLFMLLCPCAFRGALAFFSPLCLLTGWPFIIYAIYQP